MIWLWMYAASVVPVALGTGYAMARWGSPRSASAAAVVIGMTWPIMLPVLSVVVAIERAVDLGKRHAEPKKAA